MPVPAMRLTREQVDDLAVIADMPVEAIHHVIDRVADVKAVRRGEVEAAINGGNSSATMALRRTVFGLASVGRRYFASAHEVITNVSSALVRSGWNVERVRKWDERKDALEDLLSCEPVMMATKALDLSYDFAQVFLSARIITGLRPVINESRTITRAMVVTQTLRLDYAAPSGEQTSLTVAMDKADIQRLLNTCVDAQTKATLLKKEMQTDHGLDTIEPAEETNRDGATATK
jgi:hypothetical protein